MSQSISQKFTPITLLKFALPSMVDDDFHGLAKVV